MKSMKLTTLLGICLTCEIVCMGYGHHEQRAVLIRHAGHGFCTVRPFVARVVSGVPRGTTEARWGPADVQIGPN